MSARTPREIYEQYKIMPNLQLHQLRVTAVAKTICDNLTQSVDAHAVILAALFHDMGNILKFDLARFPEFVAEKGISYWSSVKEEYAQKYGKDHHAAAVTIAREIGLPESVAVSIGRVTFVNLKEVRDMKAYEQKIVDYSDLRVGPYGVLPMRGRIEEAHKRYLTRHPADGLHGPEFEALVEAAGEIEQQIFSACSIRPEAITDASIAPIIEELWSYPVGV